MCDHTPVAEESAWSRSMHSLLSLWRTLPASAFGTRAPEVEMAIVSVIATTRLAPIELVTDLSEQSDEDRLVTFNDLSERFHRIDQMAGGLACDIAGSCSAIAAWDCDTSGLVRLLTRLSQPFAGPGELQERCAIGATWLAARGVLLNPTRLQTVDWTGGRA